MTVPGGDRIKELSNTSGTVSFVLSAAVVGEPVRAFSANENAQVVRYVAKHVTAQEAESGYGVYTHSTRTLTRLYRYYPTRGAAAVSFSAGGVHVACTAIVGDILPNITTTNPTVTDDRNAGYLAGMEWINSSSGAIFKLVSDAVGAADWDQINGSGIGALGDLTDVGTATPTTRHLLQANGTTWEGVLSSLITGDFRGAGVETLAAAFTALTGGADAAPVRTLSTTTTEAMVSGAQLHTNGYYESHAINVDFEVPAATAQGRAWRIRAQHDGAVVSVVGNVGSVNGTAGGSARLINGGEAIAFVASNAGSVPVVIVIGDVIALPISVGGTKTYDNDDARQDFKLTTTSTQTIGAAAGFTEGFFCNIFATTGTTTIAHTGGENNYSAVAPDAVTIMKVGTAMWAIGKAGVVVLDAA